MIPTRRDTRIDSTLAGEDVVMTLDERATAHLMFVLTDLYSDRERAVLREYATNARDSHAEAGQSRPIEVELPAPMRPTLTIRDFGVGLDAEDIRAIYSRYGASTKRGTNDATGMLGLGCKSALTLTDQFSLVGVKGGERTVVSVSRNAEGAGTMTILERAATDAPNGVEVTIPVARGDQLACKAAELFRFWEPGTVLVNGEAPEVLPAGVPIPAPAELSGAVLRVEAYEQVGHGVVLPGDVIVMGGVPYPVEDRLAPGNRVVLVAHVAVGAVDFAPSREALQDTTHTRRTLEAVRQIFGSGRSRAVEQRIAAAPCGSCDY